MVFQRHRIAVERTEDKAAIFAHIGQRLVIEMGPVEAFFPEARILVLDVDATTVAIERPAMEAAGQNLGIAALQRRQNCTPMGAGIDEGADRPVLLAVGKDRLAADMGREIIARIGNLAFMAQETPVFLENGSIKRSVLTFSERFRKESFFGRYVDAKNGVQRVQCSFSMSVVATFFAEMIGSVRPSVYCSAKGSEFARKKRDF